MFFFVVEHVPPIAGKRLVSAIARQCHCHLFAGQFAHTIGRQCGCVRKGFVKVIRQFVDQAKVVGSNLAATMIGGKTAGDRFRIFAFIKRPDIKADRTCLDRLTRRFCHQRDDTAAVDPAGQKGTQRNVRDHTRRHTLPHQTQQFFGQFALTATRSLTEIQIPILGWRRDGSPELK